jgi:hypothetical protein
MFERLRQHLLIWLRVPPTPQAPLGAPGSVRTFRAGRNFYKLCLLGWAGAQLAALIGLVVSLSFAHALRQEVSALKAAETSGQPVAERPQSLWQKPLDPNFVRFVARGPDWLLGGIILLEAGAVLAYLVALPVTYAAVRLDYELRWYAVTDRSLRIRTGLLNLQELTMSFANLQQVVVAQGPVQRLLGIADVRVQSAGGGGGEDHPKHKSGDSMHAGNFRGVDNATEIRDLILERLRRFRETGLGDPDDTAPDAPEGDDDTLDAARVLLEEARALRRTLSS